MKEIETLRAARRHHLFKNHICHFAKSLQHLKTAQQIIEVLIDHIELGEYSKEQMDRRIEAMTETMKVRKMSVGEMGRLKEHAEISKKMKQEELEDWDSM